MASTTGWAPPAGLLAPERDPQTGHQEPGEPAAKRALARPGKQNRQNQEASQEEQETPQQVSRFTPKAAAIGAAAAVLLAGAAVATALLSNAQVVPNVKPSAPVSVQPSALAFPAVPVHASITSSVTMTNNGSSPATITGMSLGGPGRHDFSVLAQALSDAAHHGSRATHPGAQPPPCHRVVPHAQTCTITVVFTPSAPGPRTGDLRIDLASPQQPQNITLSGTGTMAPPPSSAAPSSSVSVTGISPPRGTAGGGTRVVITGSGFTGATGVRFGTAAAKFTVDPSGTQVTATSPPGTGTVDVTVTTPAGASAATAADQFTYTTAPPAVTGISPPRGTAGGGTRVVITGSGFTGATGVRFGTAAAKFTVDPSGTQVTATSPPGTGTVDVTVTTPAGASAATAADQFTYTTAPGGHQRQHRHLHGRLGGHLQGDHDGQPHRVDQRGRRPAHRGDLR